MMTVIFKSCLISVAAAILIGLTLSLIALVVYLVAGVISSLIQTFRDVRTKQRISKRLTYLSRLAAAAAEENKKENDSR